MDTISRYIVSCDIAWYGAWYHDISRYTMRHHTHRITSKHQANKNSTKTHHLVAVYSCFFRLCLCPHLGWFSVRHFLSSYCCPSAGHIIGLTVPPANSNLVPSRLGLLPERMFVLLHFPIYFVFSFLSSRLFSFLIPGTWYSLVVATYFMLMICCCGEIVDVVYAIHV